MSRMFQSDDDEQLDDLNDDMDEQDEEEDDFSDVDEELQQRLARYQSKQEAKWQAELRRREEAIEGVGLTFNNRGQVAISDNEKFGRYASPFARTTQETSHTHPLTQREESEEEDEWVDPSYDKDAFQRQLDKYVAKHTSRQEQAIAGLQSFIVEDRIEQAMEKLESAVERHASYLSPFLEHPDVDGAMRTALASLPPNQWRNPKDLVRILGMVAPDLGETLPAKSQKTQKQEPNLESRARADIQRSTLRQSAPSRSTSSGKGREYSDVDKVVAEELGIPVEEAWSLGQDSNGKMYRDYQRSREKANGKR